MNKCYLNRLFLFYKKKHFDGYFQPTGSDANHPFHLNECAKDQKCIFIFTSGRWWVWARRPWAGRAPATRPSQDFSSCSTRSTAACPGASFCAACRRSAASRRPPPSGCSPTSCLWAAPVPWCTWCTGPATSAPPTSAPRSRAGRSSSAEDSRFRPFHYNNQEKPFKFYFLIFWHFLKQVSFLWLF